MSAASAEADAAGWDAQRQGRPDLRDLHWHYRIILTRLEQAGATTAPEGADMTDTTDFYPVPDDVLLEETGDAADDEATGDWTDNTDQEGDGDAAH